MQAALIYTKQCHYIQLMLLLLLLYCVVLPTANATPNSLRDMYEVVMLLRASYVQLCINIDSVSRPSYRNRFHCKAFIHLQKGNPTGCKAHIYKDPRPHCCNRGSTACQSSPDSFISALLFPMTIQGLTRHVRVSLS